MLAFLFTFYFVDHYTAASCLVTTTCTYMLCALFLLPVRLVGCAVQDPTASLTRSAGSSNRNSLPVSSTLTSVLSPPKPPLGRALSLPTGGRLVSPQVRLQVSGSRCSNRTSSESSLLCCVAYMVPVICVVL